MSDIESFAENLWQRLEDLEPSGYTQTLVPDRPYDGQSHTDAGERGRTLVQGLTMRDIRDCYIRACYDASGLTPEQWPNSIYKLPWGKMDPMAIAQNLTCAIEKRMGIFPNVARRLSSNEEAQP